jgi:putative sterol carrier protein
MTATQGVAARSATDRFFDELDGRDREPLLKDACGTLRFDLRDGERTEHRYVVIDHGAVRVSRRAARADTVVRLDKSTFDGVAEGRVNALAATLRGELEPDGDLGLLFLFQRIFPSPPTSK